MKTAFNRRNEEKEKEKRKYLQRTEKGLTREGERMIECQERRSHQRTVDKGDLSSIDDL